MRPVKQGQLDAMCGIYAIINALEPAGLKGPRSKIHQELFRRLVSGLPNSRLRAAMREGLEPADLLAAGKGAFRWLAAMHGHSFEIARPWVRRHFDSPRAFLSAIDDATSGPVGVIVCFSQPGLSHWSVARRRQGGQLLLRDSGGLRSLELGRYDLDRGRYRFTPRDTLFVTKAPRARPDA